MKSNKPYLIRAFYDWIVDNQCTPFLLVSAVYPQVKVPQQFVENGEITLDIAPHAIRDLQLKNDTIQFKASFSGVVHLIYIPVKAVLAIYAQENQQGMFFDYEEVADDEGSTSIETAPVENKKGSHLRLVD